MKIKDFKFKEGKIYTIAEIGKNHNGDRELAFKMVEIAYHAGCNAVKFQAYHTDHLLHYYSESGAEPEVGWLRQCELQPIDFIGLKIFCDNLGITFLATPESETWCDVLEHTLDVPAYKVSSLNITNYRMLDKIAEYEKPVILSTGMSYMEEVEAAANCVFTCDFAFLHCVSQYPASLDGLNLRAMDDMRRKFRVPVGFSDHTKNGVGTKLAVAAGAEIVEFHITLDHSMPGPDHVFSLDPKQLKSTMSHIAIIQKAMGNGLKRPHENEYQAGYRDQKRRCCVAVRDISIGQVISEDDIICLCPGDKKYVSAAEFYRLTCGSYIALRDIEKGTPIHKEYVGRKSCPRMSL